MIHTFDKLLVWILQLSINFCHTILKKPAGCQSCLPKGKFKVHIQSTNRNPSLPEHYHVILLWKNRMLRPNHLCASWRNCRRFLWVTGCDGGQAVAVIQQLRVSHTVTHAEDRSTHHWQPPGGRCPHTLHIFITPAIHIIPLKAS